MSITGISVSQEVRDLNAQLGKRVKGCTFNWFTAVIAADAKDGLVKDDVAASKDESYDAFLKAVTKDNVPRLGRFEFVFSTEEGRESDKIIELFWNPDDAPMKKKMIFAASLMRFKADLNTQVTPFTGATVDDFAIEIIAKKLGGSPVVRK